MRPIRLSRPERAIEKALLKGEYRDVSRSRFEEISNAIEARRKNAVLNMRVNRQDLEDIKQMARKLGVRYQTFISEFLHRLAHN